MSVLNRFNFTFLFLAMQILLSFHTAAFAVTGHIPDAIIELPEKENAIIVEKKTQTLYLYTHIGDNIAIDFKAPCSTGEIDGVKQKAGDKKTPEGIYFLKDEYENKYLSASYGEKAFPTDYPNFIDKKSGKNGSAIWIHGTNKKLKPRDSNGCVALDNFNIQKLSNYINLDVTPVIMVDTVKMASQESLAAHRNDINRMISKWVHSLETGNYHDYLSFYSSKYLPDISWWTDWIVLRRKNQSDKSDHILKIGENSVGIYYHDQVFVALFDYFLVFEKRKVFVGKRKFFLEHKEGRYKIIGDIFQKISKQFQGEKTPLIAAAAIVTTPDKKDIILETVNQWLKAWSTKDMKEYASFYAKNFYSDGLRKKEWITRKQHLARKYDYINVSGKKFRVKFKNQICEVVFFQEYESSGFTTQGTKKLKFVNKGGVWKIYQEIWKGK